jgi:hypothetical protein
MCSVLPLLLISLWAPAGGGTLEFSDPLAQTRGFPVPPGAAPDHGYARLERTVMAFMAGTDERTQQVDAWYLEERIEAVREFYTGTFGHAFTCETVDHEQFMHEAWSVFRNAAFANAAGVYEHCVSGRIHLFSPVYNYALQTWQAGTMIVFRR